MLRWLRRQRPGATVNSSCGIAAPLLDAGPDCGSLSPSTVQKSSSRRSMGPLARLFCCGGASAGSGTPRRERRERRQRRRQRRKHHAHGATNSKLSIPRNDLGGVAASVISGAAARYTSPPLHQITDCDQVVCLPAPNPPNMRPNMPCCIPQLPNLTTMMLVRHSLLWTCLLYNFDASHEKTGVEHRGVGDST